MGQDLFQEFREARDVFEEVDEAIKFKLSTLMFEGDAEKLKMTSNTQPALLAHSMAVLAILKVQISISQILSTGELTPGSTEPFGL